jgi:hypothetical protein
MHLDVTIQGWQTFLADQAWSTKHFKEKKVFDTERLFYIITVMISERAM